MSDYITNEKHVNHLTLNINDSNKYNEAMDGCKWDQVSIKVDVTITSNRELSMVLDSIRLLRGGAPRV